MSSEVNEIIQAGHDVTSTKYYVVALATLMFYDYFLTLPDEVRYAWKGRKSWLFVAFILNRYLPIMFTIWAIFSNFSWSFTYEVRCNKTVLLGILFFVVCMQIVQTILNVRIYAITMGNKIVTSFFVCITTAQTAVGIYLAILISSAPALKLPSIHLTAYQLCIFDGHRKVEIVHTAIALFYDTSVFLVIVALTIRSGLEGFKVPMILRTIVKDATVYFLVIFTSHFVLGMTLLFARPDVQLLPAVGNITYLTVMIGRLMLSLKKATDTSVDGWSLTSMAYTSNPAGHTSRYPYNTQSASVFGEGTVSSTGEDIPLATLPSPTSRGYTYVVQV